MNTHSAEIVASHNSAKQIPSVAANSTPKRHPVVTNNKDKNPVFRPRLTVVGNSLVRDTGSIIARNLPHMKTCVLSTSGLTVKGVVKQIPNILDSSYNDKDVVFFQLGSVDVKFNDPFAVASDYISLIDDVKSVTCGSRIIISAIPHRTGNQCSRINEQIDQLNNFLRLTCTKDASCRFWDVNPKGTDSDYKSDGLHFSYVGRKIYANQIVNKTKEMANFTLPLTQYPS